MNNNIAVLSLSAITTILPIILFLKKNKKTKRAVKIFSIGILSFLMLMTCSKYAHASNPTDIKFVTDTDTPITINHQRGDTVVTYGIPIEVETGGTADGEYLININLATFSTYGGGLLEAGSVVNDNTFEMSALTFSDETPAICTGFGDANSYRGYFYGSAWVILHPTSYITDPDPDEPFTQLYLTTQIDGIYYWSQTTSGGQDTFQDTPVGDYLTQYLYYHLEPIISINSEHYNYMNTRCEVYDRFTLEWQEQPLEDIVLNSPFYKIRIYDRETNDLIYQDSTYITFQTSRIVDIDSVKLINNSGENVNFTIDARNTNYPTETFSETPDSISMTEGTNSGSLSNLNSDDNNVVEFECDSVYSAGYTVYGTERLFPQSDNSVSDRTEYPTGEADGIYYNNINSINESCWNRKTSYTAGSWTFGFYETTSGISTSAIVDNVTIVVRGLGYPTVHKWGGVFYLDYGGIDEYMVYSASSYADTTLSVTKTSTDFGSMTIEDVNNGIFRTQMYNGVSKPKIYYIYIDVGYHYTILPTESHELDGYIEFDYSDIEDDITSRANITDVELDYRFYSNVSETISCYAYDWTNTQWEILTSSNPTSETAYQNTSLDYNFFKNDKSDLLFRFRLYGTSNSAGFETYFDQINVTITYNNVSGLYYTYSQSISVIVSPYSYILSNLTDSFTYRCMKYDIYGNHLENETFSFTDYTEINYTSPETRTNLIALSDQQSNYLEWQKYKLKLNGTSMYEPYFYHEIGTSWNISIYDRFDSYITSTVHTVTRDDNFISIQITLHSLKIYNQQESFAYFNLTKNPITSEYWSEWLAPHEVTEFKLIGGNYRVNLTEFESNPLGTSTNYDYTLNGDDVLLINSGNTLSGIMTNIANVNTTIGNQITNVEINLSNQNTAINNSIINLDIVIDNVNTSIGNLLLNIETDISSIDSNISSFWSFTNTSFINLNSSIDTQFINLDTNIFSYNQSISNLVIGVNNEIGLVNGTISTLITGIDNNLLVLNSTIDSSFFYVNTTISQIENDIASNYILLNNSIDMVNNNITDARLAILNNVALVNNSISSLITAISTDVYLVNNSIYTAITALDTSLTISNNSIMGNLTVMLGMNEYLTQLYQSTMFSELINWTDAYRNSTFIENQIDTWEFVNNYKNDSIRLWFKYEGLTESIILGAQETLSHILPKENVNYRVTSLATGEEIQGWDALDNSSLKLEFGFYEEDIKLSDITVEYNEWVALLITVVTFFVAVFILFAFARKRIEQQKAKAYHEQKSRLQNTKVRDRTSVYY